MNPFLRKVFHYLNKFFMIPIFRVGLGSIFVNPISGYIMVLKTIGRKSGKVRYAPVNYTLYKGNIYCISGWRKQSDWYKNVLATPEIEIILPSGSIFVRAEEIMDEKEHLVIVRQILKNAGFAGYLEGYNPYTISDEELSQKSSELPALRFRPLGVGNGPADPGGMAWVWIVVLSAIIILIFSIKLP